ncbi:hypothetical protein T484DRAFT_1758465, partial [Baffinella frigidus]
MKLLYNDAHFNLNADSELQIIPAVLEQMVSHWSKYNNLILYNGGNVHINSIPIKRNNFNHSEAPLSINYNAIPSTNAVLNDPKAVLHLTRDGEAGECYGNRATFKLSRHVSTGYKSSTRLDLVLASNNYEDRVVMVLKDDGEVSIKGKECTSYFNYNGNNSTYIRPGTTTSDVVICDVGRNLGVGLSEPTEKLHVSGNVLVGGYIGINIKPIYPLDVSGGQVRLDNAIIGQLPINTDYVQFKHKNLANTDTNYALLQQKTGATFLNASSEQGIHFRINNSSKMTLSSNGDFTVNESLYSQNCFTSTIHLGSWAIYAYSGANTDNYGGTLTNDDLLFNHTGGSTVEGLMWLKQGQDNADSLDFTGSHRSICKNKELYSSNYIGYI